MNKKSWLSLLLATVVAATGLLPAAAPQAKAAEPARIVYDDRLNDGFADYSWAEIDKAEAATVHSGSRAIRMNPSGDAGMYLYSDRIISTDDYGTLEFWMHGGETGGQLLSLTLNAGGQGVAELALNDLLPQGQPVAGEWQRVRLDLTRLELPYGIFDGLLFRNASGGEQAPVFFDDIALLPAGGSPSPGSGTGTGTGTGGSPEPVRQLESIALSPDSLELARGESAALQATAHYSDGSSLALTEGVDWSSANGAVATAGSGRVTALDAGATVITAVYGGRKATANVVVTAPVPVPPPQTPPAGDDEPGLTVFADELGTGFQNNSWASHDMNETGVVRSGSRSIRMTPDEGKALYLYRNAGSIDVKEHDRLVFYINGGATGGQQLSLALNSGGVKVAELPLGSAIEGGAVPANGWARVAVDLPALNLPNGLFDAIILSGEAAGQADVYFDDIRVLEKYVAPPAVKEALLSQYQMVLLPGDTAVLQLTVNLDNGQSADVTAEAVWTTDDPGILTVDNGVVTARGRGIGKITATYTGANGPYSASAYAQVTSTTPVGIYDDELLPGFESSNVWSWGGFKVDATEQAYSGSRSFGFWAKGYEGIWFHHDEKFNLSDFYGLEFWIHGGAAGGQELNLVLMDGRNSSGDIELSGLLPGGGLPAGQWTKVTVKMADLEAVGATFDGFVLQAWGEHDQGWVYLDDIRLLKNAEIVPLPEPELPRVSVAIDTAADRTPLSKEIFGVNFEDQPSAGYSPITFPLKRWGGNQMTRYNWELDTTNRGGDWYFLNVPNNTSDPEQLPHGSLSDRFIADSLAAGTNVLLQIPTIGWTPKSRDISWSFSIDKYGAQSGDECDWGEAWCREDAGNGRRADGSYVTGNDPTDTSKRYDPEFMGRWIDHIRNKFGANAVRYYALDNEPALWGHSHWDVHPEMTTYDEIWNYTVAYGNLIKDRDPGAQVFGPVSWGWCEYFYSAKDGCYPGEDMAAHGGKPFLEWYLEQINDYKAANRRQLVDVLDIHYYPAENNVPFSSDEGAEMSKRRLNSLKSLYDRSYRDPSSWIQEPVYLLPRMQELIDENNPGMKLAITEYNFGDGSGISSGLAQAEALALFARYGVDLATRWGNLPENSPLEDAFKLYLNYDGQGSSIEGDVVRTDSSNVDAVGAYTINGANGEKFILLFNKDTGPRTADITINETLSGSAELYRFDARQRLQPAGTMETDGSEWSVKLPARSATLIVIN